ncbi:hypothetical protein SSX86_029499 [Deinandra increscens subsp. villosa]|uniref:Uncharacterized protein n=1 Tax=Deinandra increscens subsp. villosa TaxID=3103831 RepID=A0AAP0CGI8_9ASTR
MKIRVGGTENSLSPITCHVIPNPSGHVTTYISSLHLHVLQSPPSFCDSWVILEPPRNKLVGIVLFMMVKPFTLLKLSCMAGVRGTSIVMNTWIEILVAFISFNISIFWRFVVWTLCLITLPARALAALWREKQLQAQLSELQDRVDSLLWDRKELQEHLRVAVKEHEMMEMLLGEVEEEHNEAIHEIKLLESALHDLKGENIRLKEVHGKSLCDTNTNFGASYGYDDQKHKSNTKDRRSHYYKDGIAFTMMHKDGNYDAHDYITNDSGSFMHYRKEVAVSQSLFSAVLSVVVGMVVWEAQEPCMPLVMALFMVVGMSLKSVVRFFSAVKNRPASDTVALLSLHWFILGTLTYPILPRVAHISAPLFTKSFERTLSRFGFDPKFDRTT